MKNVLLIGDTIRLSYEKEVAKRLADMIGKNWSDVIEMHNKAEPYHL